MDIERRTFLQITAAFVCFQSAGKANADTGASKIRTDLQVAMQRHLERSQVEGAIHFINREKAAVQRLYPVKAHPLILKGDGFFVLCAELRDESGKKYEVDFYMVEARRGYRVVMTEIENRDTLREMMRNGHVKKF